MSLEDPVVLTCAISGALANRDQCAAIPYTLAEYAAEARRAVDAGAVHIHIHARRPDGTPSTAVEDFLAIKHAIVEEIGDGAIINFSTGTIGVDVATRVAYLEAGRPEVAALNMGSMNYAKYSRSRQKFVFDFVFSNPWSEIIELLEAMRGLEIKPEHECFDTGHVASLAPLVDMGLLSAPLHADFIMGVLGGIPPTPRNLAAALSAPQAERLGGRVLVQGGLVLSIGGYVFAAVFLLHSEHVSSWAFIPCTGLLGLGMGVIAPSAFATVTAAVSDAELGSASGTLEAVQQLGSAIGCAVLPSVFFGTLAQHGFHHALSGAMWWAVGSEVLALALSPLLPRQARPESDLEG